MANKHVPLKGPWATGNSLADIYANVRNKALEEAAKKCESFSYKGKEDTATGVTAYFLEPTSNLENLIGFGYAAMIRALKTPERS